MNFVYELFASSPASERKMALSFLEQFGIDVVADHDNFCIVDDDDGGIYHEIPLDFIQERNIKSIGETIKLCLDDCVYEPDDDITWVNTIESMKYFWR